MECVPEIALGTKVQILDTGKHGYVAEWSSMHSSRQPRHDQYRIRIPTTYLAYSPTFDTLHDVEFKDEWCERHEIEPCS